MKAENINKSHIASFFPYWIAKIGMRCWSAVLVLVKRVTNEMDKPKREKKKFHYGIGCG